MFDYLQQFNNLPKNLRDQVSSPSAMAVLTELENKYKLDLAMVVMKVMIKNIDIKNLAAYFTSEGGLLLAAAENLTRELKEKIFVGVADYLGITSDIRALDLEKDIKVVIAEAGLTLASSELVNRFKNILATYLKGIRAKIDTRAILGKEVVSGGLNLSVLEIDRVFKVCEIQKFKSLDISVNSSPANSTLSNRPVMAPVSQLDKIINNSDGKLTAAGKIADYNLKEVIARGQIKKPALLNLPSVERQLGLPAVKPELNLAAPIKLGVPPKPVQENVSVKPNIPAAPLIKKAASITPVLRSNLDSIPKPISISTSTLKPIPSAPIIPPRPVQVRQNVELNPNHPSMHDIKPMPKVIGPIEELQFLDVLNFRRLGDTPAETVTKIFNKIKQLEKEGYDKMILGIKAWRQSPVNILYIKIGQAAISKVLTIKEAALAYQKTNPEYLKIEEIEAIVGLNSKLVF